jgi:(1->4)-alpha-D-glucan 1-alpha-D-glucosylmutase
MTPRATVRLQLHRGFGFDAARAQVDYYDALGISHFYLSPIFRARAGSMHGYDTTDFAQVSDELGGRAGLERLAAALHARGMGLVVDIVPNHMGVAGNDNRWWNDVLARGRASAFAGYFDIDWTPSDAELRGKVLLPFLDGTCDDVLARGALEVVRDEASGGLAVACHDARWPVAPHDAPQNPDPREFAVHAAGGRERLRALLAAQHYVLDDWRRAGARINWRRFFDIAELAALRVEDERVFDDVHGEVLALFAAGTIDGVRVDHVDGLADPLGYCRRLRAALGERAPLRPPPQNQAPVWIVVEKVFAAQEPQRDWGVAGTTGYDFMDQVGALLHNPAGQRALDELWRDTCGRPWEYWVAVDEARRQILAASFGADRERVARAFFALVPPQHDPTLDSASLRRALTELIVAFPVYRCYGLPGALPPEDAAILAAALERANRHLGPEDFPALDFLARCLRDEFADAAAQRAAVIRFQQLTAAIAARAIEDTVFYREARLLSRNEVGSDPNVFALGADAFHAACAARAQRFPHGLLATATHDTKRGEDARARLAVLSDAADDWLATVARWRERNAALRAGADAPDAIDEMILYQSLVGAWPLAFDDEPGRDAFRARAAAWWRKALREAKRHSSWAEPNTAYEDACLRFLDALFARGEHGCGADAIAAWVDTIAAAGALNGLTQAFLRLTTPGVPDLYQGCEFWDFSFVDPDNRRDVDYGARAAALARAPALVDALADWRDGRIKQQLIARVLAHRRDHARFHAEADYRPLTVCGERAAHAIAFERRLDDARMVCIATRWPQSLAGAPLDRPHVDPARWEDAFVELGDGPGLRDVLCGSGASGALPLADALREFPVALFVSG